mmetsp:Transcript_54799/g.178094  ORF Transcript_54799/g.178094 Transcript_54799/m.178094 type:complete len:227 (-) Transcript_54799:81-761(-)
MDLRYVALVFFGLTPKALEQSSSASTHFFSLMYAKARLECKIECKSLGTSLTFLVSTNQRPLENHLTASSKEPLENKAFAWFLALSTPDLLCSTLRSGKGSVSLAAGEDAFGLAGGSSSLSLASTICILLKPDAGSVALAGEAALAGGATSFGLASGSSSLSLASTICILLKPGAAPFAAGFVACFSSSLAIFSFSSTASLLLEGSGKSFNTCSTSCLAPSNLPNS